MTRTRAGTRQDPNIDNLTPSILQLVLRVACSAGMNLPRLIAQFQLPYDADDILHSPALSMPRAHLAPLYKEAMMAIGTTASRREHITPTNFEELSMMCYAIINCRDLAHAISRSARFMNMMDGRRVALILETSGGSARFSIDSPRQARSLDNLILDLFGLYSFHQLFSWMIGEPLPITQVTMSYGQMVPHDQTFSMFNQRIIFDEAVNSISFPREFLTRAIVRSYNDLVETLEAFPFDIMPCHLISEDLAVRVRAIFRISLVNEGKMASLECVAGKLNIGAATLRRRLAREDTSIHELKAECRRDVAIDLLRQTALSVEEVAFRTGFSAPSAFRRAFHAWTGMSPSAARRSGGAADPAVTPVSVSG